MRISPIEIGLPIVVDKRRGVDVVPNVFANNECFSKRIFEWAIRRIGYQYANATAMHGAIHIKFTVALDALYGPSAIVLSRPLKIFERSHCATLLPIHHVGGGIKQPVEHFKTYGIVLVVRYIKKNGVVINHRRWVGRIFGLYNWALRGCVVLCIYTQAIYPHCYEKCKNECCFHVVIYFFKGHMDVSYVFFQ